ncbi:MAG: protein TolR [Deltaproteobacteria bacterium CG07_land_8_20_14_0_80_38_7]|nr:MAG: protein TolR [Deltaproteobacteria bacterium CG07_land_8_20_14_0_80_38_7]
MKTLNGNNNRNRLASDINITPFVDVVLVLLIIFMVTAPLLQQGLPVNLPEASAPALKRAKTDVIVTVQQGDKIYIGDDQTVIPIEELEGRLGAIYNVKEEKDLFIKADSNLLYGTVIKVMSIAKKAGVARIGMITQPELSSSL